MNEMKYKQPYAPKSRSHANRGMYLEKVIDLSNTKYRNSGVADIRKVPTPFKILGHNGKHSYGHTERGEWVDYCGISGGKIIIFDAKETNEKRFPLDNTHEHQYNLLKSWSNQGAIAFLLVYFKHFDKYYVLPFHALQTAWEVAKSSKGKRGTQSIPFLNFEEIGIEVKNEGGYALHYLKALEVMQWHDN